MGGGKSPAPPGDCWKKDDREGNAYETKMDIFGAGLSTVYGTLYDSCISHRGHGFFGAEFTYQHKQRNIRGH